MTLKLRCKVEQATIHEGTGLLLQPGEIEIAETPEAYAAAKQVCDEGFAEPVLSEEQLAAEAKRIEEERLAAEEAAAEALKAAGDQGAVVPNPEGTDVKLSESTTETITPSDIGGLDVSAMSPEPEATPEPEPEKEPEPAKARRGKKS